MDGLSPTSFLDGVTRSGTPKWPKQIISRLRRVEPVVVNIYLLLNKHSVYVRNGTKQTR